VNYSKGISWFDDCRIPFVDGDKTINHNTQPGSFVGSFGSSEKIYKENTQGRFPANLLVSDDMLNDGIIHKSGKNNTRKSDGFNKNAYGIGIGVKAGDNNGEYGDKGTNSRYYDIDKWFEKMIETL